MHKSIKELEKIYNTELKNVKYWLDANKLSLNVSKSNMILFRKTKKKLNEKLSIKIMGEEIEEKEYTKYLGILIDNKLTWKYHINHVNIKISQGISILSKLRNYVSDNILRMLFFTFINPHIDYGHLVWGNASITNLKAIKNKLDKAVRIMTRKKKNSPIEPLYNEMKILTLEKIRQLTIGNFMWKVSNDEIPETIKNNFQLRPRMYGDQNYKYYLPLPNSDLLKRNIIYQGPLIWNSIPSDIKNKKNSLGFKNSLRNFLFNYSR